MPAKAIDINCDLGESFGAYRLGLDAEVMKYISSANIACGWHAGDSMVMNNTVRMANSCGVAVGAHPGYPDLVGFGRRHMECAPEEVESYVTYQVGALNAFCIRHSINMTHVKPHGALYLRAMNDEKVGAAICEAIAGLNPNLSLFVIAGPQGAKLDGIARSFGLNVCREAFPDRGYNPDGSLVSRMRPDAVLSDPPMVSDRALMIAKEGRISAFDGSIVELQAETLCAHGDNQSAVTIVREIRARLEEAGISIRSGVCGNSRSLTHGALGW